MSTALRPFSGQTLDALAKAIGDYYTGSQITDLFRRSGAKGSGFVHDGGTKWKFVLGAFEHLQGANSTPDAVLAVMRTACNPQGWVGRRDDYVAFLERVNDPLSFYGLCFKDDGSLMQTGEVAKTVRQTANEDEKAFDTRSFHSQVVRHARQHFGQRRYFHAVFECCKAFDATVRANTGLDDSGQSLMGKALGLKGPVKLNAQTKQSQRDEQEGVMYLCMGLMRAVRNPQAHEPELDWPMTREDALDVLALVSFLYRKLEAGFVQQTTGAAAPVRLP